MSAIHRILVVCAIVAGLALAADLYGPPRLSVAVATVDVLLLTVVLMIFPQPKDPRL